MDLERIAKKILTLPDDMKTQVPWMKKFHHDLKKCGIKREDVENKKVVRKKIAEAKDLSEEKLIELLLYSEFGQLWTA